MELLPRIENGQIARPEREKELKNFQLLFMGASKEKRAQLSSLMDKGLSLEKALQEIGFIVCKR